MKINNSAIAMNSTRSYQQVRAYSFSTTTGRINLGSQNAEQNNAASLSISEKGLDSVLNFRQKLRDLDSETTNKTEDPVSMMLSRSDDTKLKMLKRMLEILRKSLPGYKGEKTDEKETHLLSPEDFKGRGVLDLTSGTTTGTTGAQPTTLTRITRTSEFFSEEEVTCFTGTGQVQTADGRTINFNVDLEMSRSFVAESETITESTERILCDPLVINIDAATASVTDQKFYFDLNSDGETEAVSFVGEGSGFLALDKNNDGVINDGNELFGTQSGDGFADLAAYDSDKNGWIDENDAVYSKLKVWTKDSEGNNELMDLKTAEVGAIFLGKASTEFSLNNAETNEQHAVIRSTGIFLKENGQVSTIQHVDLAL